MRNASLQDHPAFLMNQPCRHFLKAETKWESGNTMLCICTTRLVPLAGIVLENSYPVWSRLTCATCLKNLRKNRVPKCASRTIASIGVSAKWVILDTPLLITQEFDRCHRNQVQQRRRVPAATVLVRKNLIVEVLYLSLPYYLLCFLCSFKRRPVIGELTLQCSLMQSPSKTYKLFNVLNDGWIWFVPDVDGFYRCMFI